MMIMIKDNGTWKKWEKTMKEIQQTNRGSLKNEEEETIWKLLKKTKRFIFTPIEAMAESLNYQ